MHQIEQFLNRDLWLYDLNGLPTWKRWAFGTLRLLLAVISEFQHRLLDARAAGLVYTTLLSLVPFLAVAVSVLKAFGVHHYVEPILEQIVEPLGPNGQQISVRIIQFVNNLDVGVLGMVGIAGLLYTTYSLIGKVEEALNAIWRVRRGRPWTRKFTDYLSVVLVGPVLIGSAFGLLASIQSHTLVQRVLEIQPFGYLVVWAAQYLPFMLLCGVFTFFYKFLPHTDVRTSAALVGGTAAALLWGAAGKGFAVFVAGSTKYSAIYSGFAILILFLLWLYVGWLIILVGAQVAYFYQHPSAYEPRYRWLQGSFAWRERAALLILASLARRFLKGGRPMQLEDIAHESGVPLPMVEELTDIFVDAGYLSCLSKPNGIGFALPPARITIHGIFNVIRTGQPAGEMGPVLAPDMVETVLQRRDEAVEQALAELTLEGLVTDVPKPEVSKRDVETAR
ncbi:hypothetical protein YTPLAS18_38880 [Nitrospira sp.]|nr:hypothetical protein YTPLAS18_38880 [Nitrospira sp.]